MAAQKDKKQQPSKGGAVELSEKDLNEVQGGIIAGDGPIDAVKATRQKKKAADSAGGFAEVIEERVVAEFDPPLLKA